ncbi:MAG: deoxyribonuclease IV [Muribaculaceae bacterium]|nr:deoxyribonuclease IV [Muribaculaceae bacterium]
MKYLGAHIDNLPRVGEIPLMAKALGASAFAFCPVDPKLWRYPAYPDGEAARFSAECVECGYTPAQILPHASLLLNLCSPDARKLKLSRDSFTEQMRRVASLGLDRLNFHPGSHMRELEEEAALDLVAASINYALERTEGVTAVIENMAGQGSNLGYTFAQLARIIDGVADKSRVGVCIDTCHAFAAGYDMSTPEAYEAAWQEFADTVGFGYLRGMHINDSLKPLASRVDRHASIGKGELGTPFFGLLMADRRLDGIPLILETPDPSLWQMEIGWLRAAANGNA